MDGEQLSGTSTRVRNATSLRTTAIKRDSLMAELERDPQHSTAKRQQRTQAFTSQLAHASLERQLAALTTTKNELEKKSREKDVVIDRLEKDRRWLAEREKEEREEKERERIEWDEAKRQSDGELRTLRASLTALREEHADLQDAHSSLSRGTSQTIASQKSQLSTLTHQTTLLTSELAEFKSIADQRNCTIQTLQDQLDELNGNQDSLRDARRGAEEENWSVVREELHRQADYLRTLEGTNAKMSMELNSLRERHASVEVLREEKRGLERKVKVLEELREKVVKLEAEVEAGRREREEWANKSAENMASTPSKTPVALTQSLSALRLSHARLLEDHGATKALLRQCEAKITAFEQRESEAQHTADSLRAEVRGLREKVERSERTTALAEREVGFLQALVASFTAEETSQDRIDGDTTPRLNSIEAQRVQQLETLLAEYKATVDSLAKEMNAIGGGDPLSLGSGRSRKELAEEAEIERAAKAEMQKVLSETEAVSGKQLEKIEELEQTLFELRGEIGTGNHIPPGVRVLSLKQNPAQEWSDLRQAVMDRLKGENEALIKRLKELEEGGHRAGDSDGDDLVPRESWEVVNKEKTELEEVVKQKEKRLLRLQQVFTAKSAEFREAIASILGLKLAFYPNGQVRVTSVYDLSASFVFQPATKSSDATGGEAARMQLIAQGEGGPQDLPQLMRYWVEDEQCIPGFLASVTLECWEKVKRESGEVV